MCTAIYLVVNLAYLYALPVEQLRGDNRVGESVARVFFGAAGGAIGAALILASIVSCLNATILVGPRIAYAMAIDGLFFGGVDRVHAVYQTPHVAIVVQGLTAVALVVGACRTFPSVLDYTTFAIVLATMADTTALYALRRRQPDRPRPYRAWGYPMVPALYLVANGRHRRRHAARPPGRVRRRPGCHRHGPAVLLLVRPPLTSGACSHLEAKLASALGWGRGLGERLPTPYPTRPKAEASFRTPRPLEWTTGRRYNLQANAHPSSSTSCFSAIATTSPASAFSPTCAACRTARAGRSCSTGDADLAAGSARGSRSRAGLRLLAELRERGAQVRLVSEPCGSARCRRPADRT